MVQAEKKISFTISLFSIQSKKFRKFTLKEIGFEKRIFRLCGSRILAARIFRVQTPQIYILEGTKKSGFFIYFK